MSLVPTKPVAPVTVRIQTGDFDITQEIGALTAGRAFALVGVTVMAGVAYTLSLHDALPKSEERRVGKECTKGATVRHLIGYLVARYL